MAFDIFLSCMKNGQTSTFKRSLAQEILGRGAVDQAGALFQVEYADGSGSSVYCDEGEDLDGAMFNHSGGDTFFERLWELADRTHSIIVWPGYGIPVAITRSEMLPHLWMKPEEMEPPPFVVLNGKELQEAIAATG